MRAGSGPGRAGRLPDRLYESFVLRRVARRMGWRPRTLRAEAPERPVGAKLELTHACNLRCGFCYTDSPRHTLLRTADLSDEQWLAIADEAAELGVIEVVLSGGEPFLRPELVFALLERLEERGVGLTLNTNGWFVDDDVADRLARFDGLMVDISIDGATPALHDGARGVPGSWRRAVGATSRLLDRGVRVQVVHVVTPANEFAFADFLDQMVTLGVSSVRVTPVVEIGAAARGGRWSVSRVRLRRSIERCRRIHGGEMRVVLQPGTAGVLAVHDDAAPAAVLVRPSGDVMTDSLHPFVFGNAVEEGLAACWQRIVANWRDPAISRWTSSLRTARDIPASGAVPYLDDGVRVGAPAPGEAGSAKAAPRRHADDPLPTRATPRDDSGDVEDNLRRAREEVRRLALERRYRLSAVRVGGGPREHYVRTAGDGGVVRLNRTAAFLVRALDGGTPGEAVDRLAARFADTDRGRLEHDVLATGRSLSRRGILVAAGAARSPRPAGGADDVTDALSGGG